MSDLNPVDDLLDSDDDQTRTQNPVDALLDSVGPRPKRNPVDDVLDSLDRHATTPDDRPGPYAKQVEALFTAPKPPAGSMRDVTAVPGTGAPSAHHHQEPVLGTVAKALATPFENPAGFAAQQIAAIPHAIATLGAPSPNGADELFRPGTDEPQAVGDASPASAKEKLLAAAQLATVAAAPGISNSVRSLAAPLLGEGGAALAGGAVAGALPGAAFMPEHPILGGIMGAGAGALHAVAGFEPRVSPSLADVPDRLLADPTATSPIAPNASVRVVDQPMSAAAPPPDYTVEPLTTRAKPKRGTSEAPAQPPPTVAKSGAPAPEPTILDRIAEALEKKVPTPSPDATLPGEEITRAPTSAAPTSTEAPNSAGEREPGVVRPTPLPAGAGGASGRSPAPSAGAPEAADTPAAAKTGVVPPLEARPPLQGVEGRDTDTFLSDGRTLKTRYAIVDASDLQASHHPITFTPNPLYPEGIQGRAYHGARGTAARQQVETETGNLRPDVLLDAGSGVTDGPPVVTPHGIVVAGNQRTMMLQRAPQLAPKAYASYRQALGERAASFGVDPRAIAGKTSPVLVRVITDPSIDVNDPKVLGDLNRVSDQSGTKTKDVVSAAMGRATALQGADEALAHLDATMGHDTTVREYLSTTAGRQFVRLLGKEGVIAPQELPDFVDAATNTVHATGRQAIEDMMLAAAIGDPEVMANANANAARTVQKLTRSVPALIAAHRAGPAYSLQPTLQDALTLLARGGARQLDAFSVVPQSVLDLAHFIETHGAADVATAMREYARSAQAATDAGQSEDMFGTQPETAGALGQRVFGGSSGRHAMMEPPRKGLGENAPDELKQENARMEAAAEQQLRHRAFPMTAEHLVAYVNNKGGTAQSAAEKLRAAGYTVPDAIVRDAAKSLMRLRTKPTPVSEEVEHKHDFSSTQISREMGFTREQPIALPNDVQLPPELDTTEVRAARVLSELAPRTSTIDTPERERWRDEQAALLDNGTKTERRADIVMGAAGSGKTSTVVGPLAEDHGASVLDSDIVKRNAPEWERGLGASALHVESANVRMRALEHAMRRGANIVFPTVGDPKLTPGLAKLLQENGYTVHAHLVDVPAPEAARRVLAGWKSGDRHFVDPVAILQRGDEPRRGYAAVANLKGVIAHAPLDNHVPRGEQPRPVADWRTRWKLENAGDAAQHGAGPVSPPESRALRSGRPRRVEADHRDAQTEAAGSRERREGSDEVATEPATSGLESSQGSPPTGERHSAIAPGGAPPRAKSGSSGAPPSGKGPGATAAPAPGAHPMPEPAGLGEPRAKLRPIEFARTIQRVFLPESLGNDARLTAAQIRHETAERFRALAQATSSLSDLQAHVEKQPRARQVALWDAYETGKPTGDQYIDAANRVFARVTEQRTKELIRLDRLSAERAIENYVGRFWGDSTASNGAKSAAVNNFLGSIFAKRPFEGSKSFLKHRSIEHFVDGLDAGLVPATYNYVESQLAKIAEMERLIGAIHMLRAEQANGRAAPVMLGKDAPTDVDGNPWVKIDREGNDPAFTLYAPPTHTVHEAFDAAVREGLEAAIARLKGLTHTRAASVGRGKLGWASDRGDEMASRFGSHDGVIMHELGHILDARYKLRRRLAADPRTTGELKALAELRYEGDPNVTQKFKDYTQQPAERVANALHALMHAPDRMEQVAPVTKQLLTDFFKGNRALAPLLDIKPSLRFGTGTTDVRLPGPVLAGHWYAPRNSAAVWHAHLSKGLRGNPVYDAATAPGMAATQLLLGFSGFHATTIATEGMFSSLVMAFDHLTSGDVKGTARSLGQAVSTPITSAVSAVSPKSLDRTRSLAFGDRIMREYSNPGTHPELARVIEAMVAGGFRGTSKSELWTGERSDAFKRALRQALHGDTALQQAWGASKIPLDALYAGIELAGAPLLSRYVPLMKTAATYNAVAKRLAELPPGTPVDRLRTEMWDIVKEMDLRFGQVIYDNHFVNRVAKDMAQAMFLSPGWTFGTLALAARGMRDVGAAPKRLYDRARGAPGSRDVPVLGRSGKYVVAAVVGTMLLNGMATYWKTGTLPGSVDDGWKDFFGFRDGTKDRDGNWNRQTFPGYLMGVVYGWGKHPVHTFLNKLSPFFAFAARAIENRTYYGDMVRNPDDPAWSQAKQVAEETGKEMLPLSVQNYLEGKSRGEGGVGEFARTAFGITPAKREFVRSAAQNKMREYLDRRGHTARTPEQVDVADDARAVKEGLRTGDKTRGDVRQLEIAGELSRRQGQTMVRQARENPLITEFKQLTPDEAIAVYALANQDERFLWYRSYRQKQREAQRQGHGQRAR